MTIGNIYYLIPNLDPPPLKLFAELRRPKSLIRKLGGRILRKKNPIIGGVKVFYQHCEILNDLGYRAYPVLMGKSELYSFGYSRKVLTLENLGTALKENDIVVGTEFCPYEALVFEKSIKIVFVQNWINLRKNRRFRPEDDGKSYHEMGYDYVLACSQYIQEFVREKMQAKSYLVTNGIDLARFKPDASKRQDHRVLYMPRKNRQDIDAIRHMLRGLNLNFVAADKLSETELIAEYQKADIFLASGYPEGFGLPPLEAMACGCAVVGFTGRGANEYMLDGKTALVAPDGDCEVAASKLRKLINNPELKDTIRNGGMAIARRYSLEKMRGSLEGFYRTLEGECGEKM